MVSTAAFHARVRGSVPGLGGLKENVTVLKMVAMPIALAYVVALVRFGNDQIMCLKN